MPDEMRDVPSAVLSEWVNLAKQNTRYHCFLKSEWPSELTKEEDAVTEMDKVYISQTKDIVYNNIIGHRTCAAVVGL